MLCIWGGDQRLKPYTRQTGLFAVTLLLSAAMFGVLSASAAAPGASLNNIYAAFTALFLLGPAQSPTTYTMFFGRFLTKAGCFDPFNQREQGVPMNVRYITERFGLFQIIVIGETVIAGSAGFTGFFSNTTHQQCVCVMSLVLSVQVKLLYYELQAEQKTHALRVSKLAGYLFFFSHSLLYGCVAGMGSLLHVVSAGEDWDDNQRLLFPVFAGGR